MNNKDFNIIVLNADFPPVFVSSFWHFRRYTICMLSGRFDRNTRNFRIQLITLIIYLIYIQMSAGNIHFISLDLKKFHCSLAFERLELYNS